MQNLDDYLEFINRGESLDYPPQLPEQRNINLPPEIPVPRQVEQLPELMNNPIEQMPQIGSNLYMQNQAISNEGDLMDPMVQQAIKQNSFIPPNPTPDERAPWQTEIGEKKLGPIEGIWQAITQDSEQKKSKSVDDLLELEGRREEARKLDSEYQQFAEKWRKENPFTGYVVSPGIEEGFSEEGRMPPSIRDWARMKKNHDPDIGEGLSEVFKDVHDKIWSPVRRVAGKVYDMAKPLTEATYFKKGETIDDYLSRVSTGVDNSIKAFNSPAKDIFTNNTKSEESGMEAARTMQNIDQQRNLDRGKELTSQAMYEKPWMSEESAIKELPDEIQNSIQQDRASVIDNLSQMVVGLIEKPSFRGEFARDMFDMMPASIVGGEALGITMGGLKGLYRVSKATENAKKVLTKAYKLKDQGKVSQALVNLSKLNVEKAQAFEKEIFSKIRKNSKFVEFIETQGFDAFSEAMVESIMEKARSKNMDLANNLAEELVSSGVFLPHSILKASRVPSSGIKAKDFGSFKKALDVSTVEDIRQTGKNPNLREMAPLIAEVGKSEVLQDGPKKTKFKITPERKFNVLSEKEAVKYGGSKAKAGKYEVSGETPGQNAPLNSSRPKIFGAAGVETIVEEAIHTFQDRLRDTPGMEKLQKSVLDWEKNVRQQALNEGVELPSGDELLGQTLAKELGYGDKLESKIIQDVSLPSYMKDELLKTLGGDFSKKGAKVNQGRFNGQGIELGKGTEEKKVKEAPSGKRYQLKKDGQPEDKNLIAIHNISEKNLLKSKELGGLPLPSIAITKSNVPFTGFGEITLIADKNMIDPEKGSPVGASDTYTPRVPEKKWKENKKNVNKFFDQIYSSKMELGSSGYSSIETSIENGKREYLDDYAHLEPHVKLAYLKEKGVTVEQKFKPGETYNRVLKIPGVKEYIESLNENPFNWDYDSEQYKKYSKKIGELIKNSDSKYLKREAIDEDGSAFFSYVSDLYTENLKSKKEVIDSDLMAKEIDSKVSELGGDKKVQDWVKSKTNEIYSNPYFERGRKKVPFELNSIVDYMKSQGVRGKEKTFGFGLGNIKSLASEELKSINQIKEAGKNILTKEEGEKLYDKLNDKLFSIYDDYNYNWPNSSTKLEDFGRSLGDFFKRKSKGIKGMISALEKNDFKNISDEQARTAILLANDIKNLPVSYFEAKPQRAVDLSEFKGAVLNNDVSEEVISFLEEKGLEIEFYNSDRAGTVNEFSEKLDVRFQQKRIEADKKLIEQADKDKNFKKWFGKSQVVDEKGNPKIVYHGTSRKFNKFNKQKSAQGIFWFSEDIDKIKSGGSGAQSAKKIIPVYLKAENLAGWPEYEKYSSGELIGRGFDGVKLDDDYIIFEPNQIKSAKENIGTFDPKSNDIRYHQRWIGDDPKKTVNEYRKIAARHGFIANARDIYDKVERAPKDPKRRDAWEKRRNKFYEEVLEWAQESEDWNVFFEEDSASEVTGEDIVAENIPEIINMAETGRKNDSQFEGMTENEVAEMAKYYARQIPEGQTPEPDIPEPSEEPGEFYIKITEQERTEDNEAIASFYHKLEEDSRNRQLDIEAKKLQEVLDFEPKATVDKEVLKARLEMGQDIQRNPMEGDDSMGDYISETSGKKEPSGFLTKSERLYTKFVDEAFPLLLVEKIYNKEIKKDKSLTGKINKLRGSGESANLHIDEKLKPIYEGLDVKDKRTLNEYLLAKRASWLYKNKHKKYNYGSVMDGAPESIYSDPFLTEKRADLVLERISRDKNFKEIEKRAQKMWGFHKELGELKVDAGVWTPEEFELFTNEPHYVPFIDDESKVYNTETGKQTGQSKYSSTKKLVRHLGKDKTVAVPMVDPVRSTIDDTRSAYSEIAKQQVFNEFIRMAKELDQDGIMFKDVTDIPGFDKPEQGQGLVKSMVNGEVRSYIIPVETADIINNYGDTGIPNGLKFIANGTNLFKKFVVQWNPDFAFSNSPRDAQEAMFNFGYISPKYFVKGLAEYWKKGELYKDYIKGGGGMGALESGVRGAETSSQDIIYGGAWSRVFDGDAFKTSPYPELSRVLSAVKASGETMSKVAGILGEASEMTTRLAVFAKALDKGMTTEEAVNAGRGMTLDFNRIGSNTKSINAFVPFFNAAIQGLDRQARTIVNNPRDAGIRWSAYSLLPMIALTAFNSRNEEYKNIAKREKDSYWILMKPGGKSYFKVAKAHSTQAQINWLQSIIESYVTNTMHTKAEDVALGVANSLSPVQDISAILPPYLKVPIEMSLNYDLYWEKDIVTYPGNSPAYQINAYTSETMKHIGKALNFSPAKMEHIARGLAGGTATNLLWLMDVALGNSEGKLIPEKAPFTRRVYGVVREWGTDIDQAEKGLRNELKEYIEAIKGNHKIKYYDLKKTTDPEKKKQVKKWTKDANEILNGYIKQNLEKQRQLKKARKSQKELDSKLDEILKSLSNKKSK